MNGQDANAEPLPEPGTELPAGRYASSVVGPRIEFRVDDGWLVGPSGDGPIFTLERTDEPGTVLSVTRFDGDVFLDSCDPSSLTSVETTVPRLMEVIGGNPYLNPGPPSPLDVDGFSGLWMDVATPAYEECDLPWLLIWALPIAEGGEFVQVADQQSRFLAVDVDGDVIVIAIESFPGVPFGGLLEASLARGRLDAHRARGRHAFHADGRPDCSDRRAVPRTDLGAQSFPDDLTAVGRGWPPEADWHRLDVTPGTHAHVRIC